MFSSLQLAQAVSNGEYDGAFAALYGAGQVEKQRDRYKKAIAKFEEIFGNNDTPLWLFSSPGRTEICGNHTDHNGGHVVAASVNLDVIAVVRPCADRITVQSAGHLINEVALTSLNPLPEEEGESTALVRGVTAGLQQAGWKVGGFEAYTISNIPGGSGLSSSAAFETLIGTILNHLYNDAAIPLCEIAKIAQYAENVYYNKPCGLMDQMACAVGNVITIDFSNDNSPRYERLEFDFSKSGHALCIIEVGGNHADLTAEYAAIPGEMKAIAASLGGSKLCQLEEKAVWARLSALRLQHGDRAVMRALHFYQENRRVNRLVSALKSEDFPGFLKEITDSGASSFRYLQNVFVPDRVREQSMSISLLLAEELLAGRGACRVHGGGFGGTIQCFVPLDMLDTFVKEMDSALGEGSCKVLSIRPFGNVCLSDLL